MPRGRNRKAEGETSPDLFGNMPAAKKKGRAGNRPDRIIVLTPNEGLLRQQENWGTSNVKLRAAHDFW